MSERVKGYLVVRVCEATGKNKDDAIVWDPSFVEGFVKGEGKRTAKKKIEKSGTHGEKKKKKNRRNDGAPSD